MNGRRIDLLLGSDIGLWIVDAVRPEDVGTIVTRDATIAAAAAVRGMKVADTIPVGATAPAVFSAHWPAIVTAAELEAYEAAWNLHPGLLPWGRGYAPVFWALWAGEPAGATLHVMSAGLDKGPIVDQRPVEVRPDDTGASLYGRVLEARKAIFSEWLPRLLGGERPAGVPQTAAGSYHSRAEFVSLRDEADVSSMSAVDLIRLVRALSMPGMPGLRIAGGRRLILGGDEES